MEMLTFFWKQYAHSLNNQTNYNCLSFRLWKSNVIVKDLKKTYLELHSLFTEKFNNTLYCLAWNWCKFSVSYWFIFEKMCNSENWPFFPFQCIVLNIFIFCGVNFFNLVWSKIQSEISYENFVSLNGLLLEN